VISEHSLTASELINSFLLEKNTLAILSFWKGAVHNFFSNAFLDKSYQILGVELNKEKIEDLFTISRLKVIQEFGECIKNISKNKMGKFIHRMSSLNSMKAPAMVDANDTINELTKSNLTGFNEKQEIGYIGKNLKFRISVIGLFNKFHVEFIEMQKLILHWYFVSTTECSLKKFPILSQNKKNDKDSKDKREVNSDHNASISNFDFFSRNITPISRLPDNIFQSFSHNESNPWSFLVSENNNGESNAGNNIRRNNAYNTGEKNEVLSDKGRSIRLSKILDKRSFPKKNLSHFFEFYKSHLYHHKEMNLRKLFISYPYLFVSFNNTFLFAPGRLKDSKFFDQIGSNIKQMNSLDKNKLKKEIAEQKFKIVKKIFCKSLWIENNPFFIEEILWRFLISSPKTFCNFFKKDTTSDQLKLMEEKGFIKNAKIYKRLIKRLQRSIDSMGK
jgi:hypothetical protein